MFSFFLSFCHFLQDKGLCFVGWMGRWMDAWMGGWEYCCTPSALSILLSFLLNKAALFGRAEDSGRYEVAN